MLRPGRKADVDPHTRPITSIYLPEEEFAVLAGDLPGLRIHKLRPGVVLSVDAFQGDLAELFMVEVEFDTAEMMASFAMPGCAFREVATDPRFTGGSLARNGRPKDV